jgi:hypothetical protein
MKSSSVTLAVKKVGLVLMLVTFFSTSIAAQVVEVKKYQFKENSIKSLISGISNENIGVRRASIYYCGKYSIEQTVDALVDQLEKEQDPSVRFLIVLSLFNIGDSKGLKAIYSTASVDRNDKVKKICTAICDEIQKNRQFLASSVLSK